jgi:F0F1-type ATP synthase membrane subunit b/b'
MIGENKTNIIWMVAVALIFVAVVVWAGWPAHPPAVVTP